jgi:hypothetical protein
VSEFPTLGVVGGPDYSPRTMSQAAVAAESQAFASSRGRRIKCNRGRGWMTTAECVALYWAGQDDPEPEKNPCSRDLGCSAGRMRAINFEEDDMSKAGRTNYGNCVACGRKGNRDSAGQCYRADCKIARKVKPAKPESPILDDGEFEVLGEGLGTGMGGGQTVEVGQSGQDETTGEAEGIAPGEVASGQDHIVDATEMVPDFAAPFAWDGFEFDPATPPPPAGQPTARLSPSGNFHISSPATRTHNLLRYKFVRIIPDKTGTALALIFSADAMDGARSLAAERKSPHALKASARQVARTAPAVVGKTLELRSMGQDGALLAVVVGEVE